MEREYARLYREIGLGTTVWSPLASGLLTGKYDHGIPDGTRAGLAGYGWLRERFESEEARRQVEKVKRLRPIADDLGISLPRLTLAWCLANPNVSTVITGASKVEQVVENLRAVDDVALLTPAVLERIDEVLDNRPQPVETFR